jgi:membrane fusion protein (multidrug efflux system)
MYRDKEWLPAAKRQNSNEAQARPEASLTLVRDETVPKKSESRIPAPSALKELEPETARSPDRIALDGGQSAPASTGAPARNLKMPSLIVAVALALGGVGWYGYHWLTVGRFIVSTDDAYVRAHNTTLAAKISGYLSSIEVEDNSFVHAGDVIARIDDGDYQLAVSSARDKVATQQATVDRLGRQIVAQQANVDQARALVASAEAVRRQSESEFDRQQSLASKAFASQQTLEKAIANRDQAVAGVASAGAALDAAQANVDVLRAQQQEAARTLDEYKTALAKAERDLSFAVIRSPIDGMFGNRAVQTGDYVQPGQRLASLVPLDEVFVDANFKETQLARLRPGQSVEISVDALPGETVRGTIDSMSPASGSVFSLLPPDNATGNFTKIVQRLPVRIRIPADCRTAAGPATGDVGGREREHQVARRCYGISRAAAWSRRDDRPANEDAMSSAPSSVLAAGAPSVGVGRVDERIDAHKLVAFLAMVFGMFMAILDIQIVSASLTEIQAGLSASNDEIAWVQTAYLVAEVVAIPISGFLSRAWHAHSVCRIGRGLHHRKRHVRDDVLDQRNDRVAGAAGVYRRGNDPDRLRLGLSDFSPLQAADHHPADRAGRDARSDRRSDHRRLSHRYAVMALAVLHQRGAGRDRDRRGAGSGRFRQAGTRPVPVPRLAGLALHGGISRRA